MGTSRLVAGVLLLAVVGCNGGERARLEQRNAELQAEKAALEKRVAELQADVQRADAQRAEAQKAELQKAEAQKADVQKEPDSADERNLQAAQDAYVAGRYTQAIALARKATSASPSKAWRIIGAADCFLHDSRGVKEAVAHVGEQERQFLRYVCQRNATKLD